MIRIPHIPINSTRAESFITLDILEEQVTSWCIALTALRENLIEKIPINSIVSTHKGIIHKANYNDYSIEGTFILGLNQNTIEYIIVFLLKYLRDGWSEVDHLDVSTTSFKNNKCFCEKTIIFRIAYRQSVLSST